MEMVVLGSFGHLATKITFTEFLLRTEVASVSGSQSIA